MIILPIGLVMIIIMLIGGGKAAVLELLMVLLVGALAYFMSGVTNPKFGHLILALVALLALQVFAGTALPILEKVGVWLGK